MDGGNFETFMWANTLTYFLPFLMALLAGSLPLVWYYPRMQRWQMIGAVAGGVYFVGSFLGLGLARMIIQYGMHLRLEAPEITLTTAGLTNALVWGLLIIPAGVWTYTQVVRYRRQG
jgi:hypothetical protein